MDRVSTTRDASCGFPEHTLDRPKPRDSSTTHAQNPTESSNGSGKRRAKLEEETEDAPRTRPRQFSETQSEIQRGENDRIPLECARSTRPFGVIKNTRRYRPRLPPHLSREMLSRKARRSLPVERAGSRLPFNFSPAREPVKSATTPRATPPAPETPRTVVAPVAPAAPSTGGWGHARRRRLAWRILDVVLDSERGRKTGLETRGRSSARLERRSSVRIGDWTRPRYFVKNRRRHVQKTGGLLALRSLLRLGSGAGFLFFVLCDSLSGPVSDLGTIESSNDSRGARRSRTRARPSESVTIYGRESPDHTQVSNPKTATDECLSCNTKRPGFASPELRRVFRENR